MAVKYSKGFIDQEMKRRVYSTFTNERYTTEEIFDKINMIQKSCNLPPTNTRTKATQIFNLYFESIECQINIGKGRVKGKKIVKKIAE